MSISSMGVIEASQAAWSQAIARDPERPTYARTITDNLFLGGVTGLTASEFGNADGAELRDTLRRPAKMRALVSSSALAVNFFDAWRTADMRALSRAMALGSTFADLRFEHVCRSYPVGSRSPNLDLLIQLSDRAVAVESKFAEPYRGTKRVALSEKYFGRPEGFWDARGLTKAQVLADTLGSQWRYLDVGQLLKHMLGLAHDGCADTLLYLWYDTGLPDADEHRAEICRFAEAVDGEAIAFHARSYQETFAELLGEESPVDGWWQYMTDRYFRPVAAG